MLCRYAFQHGPVQFVQLNTEMDFAPGSEQYAWLLEALRGVDRACTPWLVIGAPPTMLNVITMDAVMKRGCCQTRRLQINAVVYLHASYTQAYKLYAWLGLASDCFVTKEVH